MKTIFIVWLLLFSAEIFAQNVFYGERNFSENKLALYFDKDGFPYPDFRIADSSMQKAYGSIFTFFLQNGEDFIRVSAQYELFPERIDPETIYQLRDSINAVNARKINLFSTETVAFYVHGFRKSFIKQNGDFTSVEEFQLLKDNLATYDTVHPLEVEVYWDGMYDCCFSMKRKKNRQLYKMFETAGKNAINAGIGLRRILTLIEAQNLQIVAHSLGTKVVHAALSEFAGSKIPVLSQKNIRIVYLAPAISANDFSALFTRRSYVSPDNYHFLIVYNENDFVLRKKDPKIGVFGPGVKKYGNTSLGCNRRNCAEKMVESLKVKFPSANIDLLDKSSLGKRHSLRFYASNNELKEVAEFMNQK